jgi:hypothetical protein
MHFSSKAFVLNRLGHGDRIMHEEVYSDRKGKNGFGIK